MKQIKLTKQMKLYLKTIQKVLNRMNFKITDSKLLFVEINCHQKNALKRFYHIMLLFQYKILSFHQLVLKVKC